MTEYLSINNLDRIITNLKNDKIGIYPFDTIWGITGRVTEATIKRIQEVKKRNADKPFIILIPNKRWVSEYTKDLNEESKKAIKEFWPGPTTLIFPKNSNCKQMGTAESIALRVPSCKRLNQLLDTLNEPLISTSVNEENQPYLESIDQIVNSRLKDHVDFIIKDREPLTQKPSQIINLIKGERTRP